MGAADRLPSRPCLYCRQPLPTASNAAGVIACPCGISYPPALILEADDLRWDQAMRRDGFNLDRDAAGLIRR